MILRPDRHAPNGALLMTNDAFVHTSAPTPESLDSRPFRALHLMGHALAGGRAGDLAETLDVCGRTGINANRLAFGGPEGQWHTPLPALLARGTKAHRNRALSILQAGPQKEGWRVEEHESCFTRHVDKRRYRQRLGLPQTALTLIALGGHDNNASVDEKAKQMVEWEKACSNLFDGAAKWETWDWTAVSPDGEDALTVLLSRAWLPMAVHVAPTLCQLGIDPFRPTPDGSALERLEARLSVSVAADGGGVKMESAFALLAQWRQMRLDQALAPAAPRTQNPRL